MKTLFKLFVGLLWLALMLSYSLQAAVPGVPQSFSATAASASQINLSWKAPTATPALTGYELHRSEDNKSFAKIADIATGTATYQDKNLKGNTTYYYRLYALNKDGKSTAAEDNAKTQVTQTFTLSPPSNLAAASSSPTNIQVNWTNNHSYSKIELRYTTNPNNTGGELSTLNGNTTQYNLTGLEPNTKYYIVLQAFLVIEGGGEYSSIKVGTNATTQNPTPSTPSGLNITGKSDNTIGVSWNAVSGAEGYQLRISDISDFSKGVNTFDINSTTSSYKFTNLLSGNTYWIQIRAKNNFNKVDYWSNWSGSVSTSTDNPPPAAPTGVNATALSSTQIEVKWTDASNNESKFIINRSDQSSSGPWVQVGEVGANSQSFMNNGTQSSKTYYYQVCAVNSGGQNCALSNKVTTPGSPPLPPGKLVVSINGTSASLSWEDAATNETGYEIERKEGNGSFTRIYTSGSFSGTGTFNDTKLNNGTPYCYRVRAVNSDGVSTYSNEACGTTPEATPNAPSNLVASTPNARQVNLSWNNNSGNQTKIEIHRSENNDSFVEVGSIGGSSTTYTDQNLTPNKKYYYKVRALNNGGSSAFSNVAEATTLPEIPKAATGLTATAVSSSQIDLKWTDNSDNETGFDLERSSDGSNFSGLTSLGAGVVTFQNTGLSASTKYYYRVRAKNSAGVSDWSNIADATTQSPPVTVPKAATGLTATAVSSSQIDLKWTDNSDNETGFDLERSSDGSNFSGLTSLGAGVVTFQNTGLSASTKYYYRVRAKNSAGVSDWSNIADATTQSPPVSVPKSATGLTATAVSSSQIDLKWTDNSDNETGFDLERSSDGSNFSGLTSLGTGVVTFQNTGLSASTKYYYRVRAKNSAGVSDWSNIADATTQSPPVSVPKAATGLTATAVSSSQIDLKWTDNSDNETGFDLERSSDGSNFSGLTSLGAGVVTFQNTGLSASTKYYYRVRAKNSAGVSDWSNIADATTQSPPVSVPKAATGLTATAVSSSQIDLKWTDNSDNETGFDLERSSDGSNFSGLTSLGAGVVTFQNTGLSASTKYYYRVRAKNSAGVSDWSNIADATTQSPPVTVPKAATGLTATAVSSSQIDLKWTDNSDNETGFDLERSSDGSNFSGLTSLGAGVVTFQNTGLSASTKYYYRVRAKNSAGVSDWSNIADATTQSPPVTVPKAATGLTSTAVSSSQIDLKWTDNSDNETGFDLERSSDGSNFSGLTSLGAGVVTFQNTGLSASTKYYYRVRAKNSAGVSDWSNIADATTQSLPVTVFAAPTNLRLKSTITVNQIGLEWNDNAVDETGYELVRSQDGVNWNIVKSDIVPNTTEYLDKPVRSGQKYYYKVRAVRNTLFSSYSNVLETVAPLISNISVPMKSAVRAYPNPCVNYITIEGLGGLIVSVEIIGIAGNQVKEWISPNKFSFDVSDLPSGIYLMRIKDEFTATSIKIYKQ